VNMAMNFTVQSTIKNFLKYWYTVILWRSTPLCFENHWVSCLMGDENRFPGQ
jgi:hypothetical protein